MEDTKYYNIIYKAIKNHNKYKIEEGLSDQELLHCKIIRDADKLDNFRVKDTENLENILKYNPETINYETISPKVYQDFMTHKTILATERKTQIDIWVSFIAFIFDLNFDISLEYIKGKNYINKVIDRIEYKEKTTQEQMEQIRQCANQFIENKLSKKES